MRARTVAIDCGLSRCVVGVFGHTASGELQLQHAEWLERDEQGAVALWARVRELVAAGDHVVVAPPANQTLVKHVHVPRLGRRQRARVVRFEAEQALSRPPAETVWDWASVGDGKAGRVELVAMRREAAESLAHEAEQAGVDVDAIVAHAAALARALQYNYPEAHGRVVLVECDDDVALLVRGGAASPVVRLVGLPTAAPVAAGEGAREEVAGEETLRLRRLAAEIRRVLAESEAAELTPEPLLLLAGAMAPEPERLAGAMGEAPMRLARFEALRHVRLERTATEAAAETARLGALVGLALSAHQMPGANLLPPERRRENAFRRGRHRWLGLLGLTAAAVWGAAVLLRVAVAAGETEVAVLQRELAPWRAAQQRVGALRHRIEATRSELAAIDRLARARTSWGKFLEATESEFAQAGDIWIESIGFETAAARTGAPDWFGRASASRPPASGQPARLQIAGCALDPGADGRRALERVRRLFLAWPDTGMVAAVEDERFATSEPGVLRFGCALVLEPEAGL